MKNWAYRLYNLHSAGHYVWVKKINKRLRRARGLFICDYEWVRQWMEACCCNGEWEGDIISNTKGLTMLLLHFIIPHMILISQNYKKCMWFNDPTLRWHCIVCAVNNCSVIMGAGCGNLSGRCKRTINEF
jgi:hypothetical protein